MRIDIYSDTVCPWCYLGKRRSTRGRARPNTSRGRLAAFRAEFDVPVEGVDRETYMAARMPDQARLEQSHAELERLGEASAFISAST